MNRRTAHAFGFADMAPQLTETEVEEIMSENRDLKLRLEAARTPAISEVVSLLQAKTCSGDKLAQLAIDLIVKLSTSIILLERRIEDADAREVFLVSELEHARDVAMQRKMVE